MPALEPEPGVDAVSDADLIAAVRAGDTSAVDELYCRHHRAALSFAESIAGRVLAPDLVADAFLRILDLMQRGGGPSVVFRSYLYTTIRNLHVDHVRHHSRQTSLPDFGPLEAELAFGDGMDEHFEHSLVKKAFTSLPERWQIALWYTTVEGVSLEDAGTFLGVAPNAVAALTFRAREGLRQAYLAEHLNLTANETCAEVWETLPRYVRGTLRSRMLRLVEDHLPSCRPCSAAVLELSEVNSNLRGVLLLALVGTATAGSLEAVLGGAAGAPLGVLARLRHGSSATQAGLVGGAVLGTAALVAAVVLVASDQQRPDTGASGRTVRPEVVEPRLATRPLPHASARRSTNPVPQASKIPAPSRPRTSSVQATPQVAASPTSDPKPTAETPVQAPVQTPPATPTPTPTPSVTPTPTPSVTPTPTPSVTPPPTPGASPTPGSPGWSRYTVHVTLGGGGVDDVVLLVEGTWINFRVASGPGLAPWVCTQSGSIVPRLICQLSPASDVLDLGLELQTAEPASVRFSLVPAPGPLSRALVAQQ